LLRFANPEYFHLYWLVPALILFFVWAFRHKKRLLKRLGDEELIARARLTASVSRTRQIWKAILVILAFSFLVFALADPQIGTKLEEVKREGLDIFIALDVSKSMLAEDIAPNRFEKARHEISNFIDRMQGDRVGLIVFSGLAFVQCPLTLDYSAAKLFLDDISIGIVPQPGTAISEAIKTAQRSFVSRELKHKVLIIITDGEDHEGDPVQVAKETAKEGVIIYTVGIGSPQGAPIPEYNRFGSRTGYKKDRSGQVVTTRLDIPTLEKIAFETDGKFYISTTGETELDKIYEDISEMEKKELSSREFTQYENRFQVFLVIVLILLITETLLGERRKIKHIKELAV
jgi:Ca-activated chloride channel family protein